MKKTLSDKAYELIKSDIIFCVLEPGHLIAQPRLSEQYGIGMTPIRDALQRLAQEGFVKPMPRFGYMVTPITLSTVAEIYELRLILESQAARFAAVRGSDQQLQKIAENANFTYVFRDQDSYNEFLALNTNFHLSIAKVAGNQRMVKVISVVLDESLRITRIMLDLRDSPEEMREGHVRLAKALCERDADRAERIVQEQIEGSRAKVVDALNDTLSESSSEMLWQRIHVSAAPDESE